MLSTHDALLTLTLKIHDYIAQVVEMSVTQQHSYSELCSPGLSYSTYIKLLDVFFFFALLASIVFDLIFCLVL